MSQITRAEVLERKRSRYARAGREHKKKILDELVELFGYHRKAAIRALRRRREGKVPSSIHVGCYIFSRLDLRLCNWNFWSNPYSVAG